MLCGGTAYRQLMGWAPNTVQPGDPVLIWGGAGALGSMAIQITKHAGGIPVAVVSDEHKAEHCLRLGAKGVIQRNKFKHWAACLISMTSPPIKRGLARCVGLARRSGRRWASSAVRGSCSSIRGATIPLRSICVITEVWLLAAVQPRATTATSDMRFLWMRQEAPARLARRQHAANTMAFNTLIASGAINPCLTQVAPLYDAARMHELLTSSRSSEISRCSSERTTRAAAECRSAASRRLRSTQEPKSHQERSAARDRPRSRAVATSTSLPPRFLARDGALIGLVLRKKVVQGVHASIVLGLSMPEPD